tara:strand:+ start:394 stop:618 length:225 start_codon:yes stop_codon:yes gene_type:complete
MNTEINSNHFTDKSKTNVSKVLKQSFKDGYLSPQSQKLLDKLNWSEVNELINYVNKLPNELNTYGRLRERKEQK